MDPKVERRKEQTPPPIRSTEDGESSSSLVLPLVVAVILIFLTLVYFWSRKGRRGRSILIVGPCDAGKTTLFSRLVVGRTNNVQTVTSLIPNELEYLPGNGKPSLIVKDLPGHDRVQIKFWDSHKSGARGILCVVDAGAGNKGIREAADVLYRVLTDPAVQSSYPSLYIFANKQDHPMSKGIKVVRNQLEKELTTQRMTKSASLTSTGGKDSSSRVLGRLDKDFDFDQLTQMKIFFGEGTALGDKDALQQMNDWMDTIA